MVLAIGEDTATQAVVGSIVLVFRRFKNQGVGIWGPQLRASWRTPLHCSFLYMRAAHLQRPTLRQQLLGGIHFSESRHMQVEAQLALSIYAGDLSHPASLSTRSLDI